VVISLREYNKKAFIIAVQVTNQRKGYPFEVSIPPGFAVTGVILADQVKTLDWRARRIEFKDEPGYVLPDYVMDEVTGKIACIIGR
jgi:mRNA interferase MazF